MISDSQIYFKNEIYHKLWLGFEDETKISKIQCNFIYPATEDLIKKYSAVETFFVREDMETYNKITKPFIDSLDPENNRWMYNVLEGKKEVEMRVFESETFMLNKDWEFNEGDIETLYCLAMPIQRDLRTVRDLNASHLPFLKEIRDQSYKAIEERFGLTKKDVKAFFHYPPTYYHMHVHFTHNKLMQDGARAGRGVFLEDVIEHLENYDPEYYQKKALLMEVKGGTKLC